jgi:hypothetical protein
MEINSPVEMVKAIDLLLLQMDKQNRKQFLNWVKDRRKQYDFLYPTGWKPPEADEKSSKPSILVPDTYKGVTNEPSKEVGTAVNLDRSGGVVHIPTLSETPTHDSNA